MVDISAATVMKLRKISGQGMMDCKAALGESNGDMNKAVEILRKKGFATLAKRAERETSEGLVVSKTGDGGKSVVLATLCCETDFVAKNDDFIAAADALADYALACPESDGAANVLKASINGRAYSDVLNEVVSKTGEKIQVGDYIKYKLISSGLISVYVHFNKKVGTMLQIETDNDKTAGSDILKKTAADIAMHITATKPLALDKDGISAEVIEQEKSIAAAQIKNKPANIVDKIVEGKINKFFADNCLLSQPFVKDDSKSVAEVLSQAAKEAGGQAKIIKFVRFGVG
jgi:elongation factor Ts